MGFRIITPKNLVLSSMFFGFLGLIWIVQHCSKDTNWSQEFSRQIYTTNLKSIKEREFLLKKKEKYLTEKLKILGITNNDILSETLPVIFVVTPTHNRLTQKAELTRMYQTLLHLPRIHWIVIEDSNQKTVLVTNFLKRTIIPYTHLSVRTRNELIRGEDEPRWLKNRGVDQRNLAIEWIRDNFDPQNGDGVVYFADDDNTYDLRIFEMMRYTKKVSVWPVGLVGGLKWEGPVCKDGKVIRFHTDFEPDRPLPLDMSGFAINVKLLIDNPDAEMDVYAKRGYVESSIVSRLVNTEELEPLADNCKMVVVYIYKRNTDIISQIALNGFHTKAIGERENRHHPITMLEYGSHLRVTILVWHTQTLTPKLKREKRLQKLDKGSDPSMEV